MEYEIITIEEKQLIGIAKRIKSQEPDMSLWGDFYRKYYSNINGIANKKVYSLYDQFSADGCREIIACEGSIACEQPEEVACYTIPAGTYARFTIRGEVHKVVPDFWTEITRMALDRAYICDFEEYADSSTDHAEVHIYLSLRV